MGDDSQPLVRAVDMGKRYGEFVALHPLNVEVHSGEFFGVFGPNGAGKSTFIKLLTGQLQPSIGQIEVLGVDARKSPQKLKANIGIVPESESPPSFLTPTEFLSLLLDCEALRTLRRKSSTGWIGSDCRKKGIRCARICQKVSGKKSCSHPHLSTSPNFSFWMNRLQISILFISENAENGCSITSMMAGQSSSAHTSLRWRSACATAWPLSITVVFWLQERYQE